MDILRFIFFALFIHFICRSGVIFMMSMVLCLLPLQEDVLAQTRLDDKVLDGQPHQRWLLCKGSDLDLVMDPLPSPAHCYKWYRRDQPGQAFALLPDEGSRISVNPVRTAWYRCERYLRISPSQCAGTPDKIQYFKVYVIEEPDLASVAFNGEWIYKRDQGILGQPETMDEYITYILEGGPAVYYHEDIDQMEYQNLGVNIHFSSSNSQFNQMITLDPDKGFQFYLNEKKLSIPKVIQDGESKEYELTIQLEHCGLFSPEAKIKVKRLWIEEFSKQDAPDPLKFMVVLDENIKYKAQATNSCDQFLWKYYNQWPISDQGSGHHKEGTNFKIKSTEIPNSSITKYNSYGKRHGTLTLQCDYHKTSPPKALSVSSFPIILLLGYPPFVQVPMRTMGDYRSHVFYQKDDLNTTTGNPQTATPNWFYYWRQFAHIPPASNALAYNSNKPNLWALTSINSNLTGYTEIFDRASRDNDLTLSHGIHCFHEVLVHENWHYEFYRRIWTEYGPGYIDPTLDTDGDLYPDEWERNSREAIDAKFEVRPILFPDVLDLFNPNKRNSNGTIFEELGAKQKEFELKLNQMELKKFDQFDWSYDKTNLFQGKNWK